jgi:hypothetical protein
LLLFTGTKVLTLVIATFFWWPPGADTCPKSLDSSKMTVGIWQGREEAIGNSNIQASAEQ